MLYIVSTPIGNLEDISLRAIRTLKEVDLIAAEDTRHTKKLLTHYQIATPLTSYHEYNERTKAKRLIVQLQAGKNIALVSDSGSPGISDPGYQIIRLAKENEISITAIPGPCAAITALLLSNMPVSKFLFLGFLSPKQGKKRKQLEEIKDFSSSVIVYESPYKIKKTMQAIKEVLGNIKIALCREMTKKFEEVKIETADEWLSILEERELKGEIVLVFVPGKTV